MTPAGMQMIVPAQSDEEIERAAVLRYGAVERRVIKLDQVENVRGLGGIPVSGGREVRPSMFVRGSALVNPSKQDLDNLFGKRGVSCVVDVRCGWERDAHPDVQVPGIDNLHIPFFDLDKVGIEYTEPAAGTKVVGRDIACTPPRFYWSLANPLTVRQMGRALGVLFAQAQQGKTTYFHCSGGKDRAGILTVLLLSVLGVSRDDILDDYLYTNVSRDKRYDQYFQRFMRFADGNEALAHELTVNHRALPHNLTVFYGAIEQRYGTMDRFIREALGIDDALRARVIEACTRPIS